jgi:imidazolonepropionase
MIQADFVIEGASEVVTCRGEAPKIGSAMRDLGIVAGGAVAARGGVICWIGDSSRLWQEVELLPGGRAVRAEGRTVLPGFVDPHTHLPFAGTRAGEFQRRLEGATYADILREGGGIHTTVEATRSASQDQLTEWSRDRLDRMLLHGTTTCEAKSGYGLNPDQEIKQLRAIRDLRRCHIVEVVPTFLGAHVVPREMQSHRGAYIDQVVGEMIPWVTDEHLAEFCDVFCEEGAFTNREAERIFSAARQHGMGVKVHADQLSPGGTTEMAVELHAVSIDHLDYVSVRGIERLAASEVVGVLLPGASFSLQVAYPPARRLIDSGVAVALATDFNPGSSFTESMQEIVTLACLQMKMTLGEAISAATVNAACALGRQARIGSLEVGKEANLVVLDVPDHRHLGYHFGVNLVHTVVVRGKIAVVEKGKVIASMPDSSRNLRSA